MITIYYLVRVKWVRSLKQSRCVYYPIRDTFMTSFLEGTVNFLLFIFKLLTQDFCITDHFRETGLIREREGERGRGWSGEGDNVLYMNN